MSQVRFFLDSFLYYDLSGFYGHFPTDRVRVSKATILQDFTYCNHSFQSWLWWLSLQISPQGTGALKLSLLSWTWCYKSEYCLSFSETKLLLFIQCFWNKNLKLNEYWWHFHHQLISHFSTYKFLCAKTTGRFGCLTWHPFPNPFLLTISNTESEKAK